MISATANWLAANAALARKPVYLVTIEDYWRSFATESGLSALSVVTQSASRVVDFGGLGSFSSAVTFTKAVTAGNPIFVFEYGNGLETPPLTIDDTGTNTWTTVYDDGTIRCWSAIANATGIITISVSGHVHGAIAGGNFEIYAIEVPATYSGFVGAGAAGTSGTASVTAGSTTVSFRVDNPSTWRVVLIQLAPASGSTPALSLLFVNVAISPGNPLPPGNKIAGAAASQVYGNGPVYDWLTDIDDLSLTVSDLDGGADLSNLTFRAQDYGNNLTADLATFIFEGKRVQLLEGFVGLAVSDYLVRFTGRIGTVSSSNGNTEYAFDCPDIRTDLAKIIYTVGDDGFPTDGSHPKTLLGNPLDILLSILRTEIGYDDSVIDVATIENYRDTIFSGLLYEFTLTSPPAAKDFIENEILKPLGGYHWPSNLGIFKIHFFYPLAPASVATLDHDVLEDVPLAEEATLVNEVAWRFDQGSGSSSFLAESIESYGASIAKYGLYEENVIESAGMRSGFQGFLMAATVSRWMFLRYGSKQLQFENVPLRWIESLLEPGDYVSVTSSLVPDRKAGTMGITSKTFEVLDRSWSFLPQVATVKLLEADLSKFKQYLITPNAEADFAADTAPNKAKYLYLSDAAGKYSTGVTANTLC